MSMQAVAVRRDLAAVSEAISYARRVLPTGPAPDLGEGFYAHLEIGLHRIPVDVFGAALAVNDDLPWGSVTRYRDERRDDQYWSVTLELPNARLVLFSEHIALSERDDDACLARLGLAAGGEG